MGVRRDFSDVKKFFEDGYAEVEKEMSEVGRKAVSYAKATGNYEDHTGRLRASNTFAVSREGLEIGNTAEYATYVESKGYEVCASAALFAQEQLRKRFQQ